MTHAPNYTEAAIRLRIPASGDPKLDAMIREARRLDVATAAMQGLAESFEKTNERRDVIALALSVRSFDIADALLAHREKERETTDD